MDTKGDVLLKLLAQGEEDVRAGRTSPQDKVFADLRRRLKKRASSMPLCDDTAPRDPSRSS